MSYQVNFTDNLNKTPIIVEDKTVDTSTSISFPGKESSNYGQIIAENFLHLLENFSNNTPPSNPIEGQLWYDNTSGAPQLKLFDGSLWVASGGLYKGFTQPTNQSSVIGDLWVNTSTQQLFLFTGSGWILVGPKFSLGTKSGTEPEIILDSLDAEQTVICHYISGEIIAIISKVEFIPKVNISGFTTIYKGVTLNANYNKYYGISTKAEALLVDQEVVPSSSFLRNDKTNYAQFPLLIMSKSGLTIGQDSELKLAIEGSAGVLTHSTVGSNFDIRINSNGEIKTVMRIDSSERVGINNTNPQAELDVTGQLLVSNGIKSTDITETTSVSTGSLVVDGGVGIAKSVNVGVSVSTPVLTIGNTILPSNSSVSIGTTVFPINQIYADNIYTSSTGQFYGNLIGNVTGSATGSSSRLASETKFTINGDIISNSIFFNGAQGDVEFTTQLNDTFITSKEEISSINNSDEFIVSRPLVGLKKITKENLWNFIPKIPIGAIMPYAGIAIPSNWLLCDGSEVLISSYPMLFNMVGYIYGDVTLLSGTGTFRLPDLRGRVSLGLDNMNNNITVPDKNNPNNLIQSGGGSANRVTLDEADILGLGVGTEKITLDKSNLPDHTHDLRGDAGNQYYAFRNISGTPDDTDAITGAGSTTQDLGQYLDNSGSIATTGLLQQPINIMNPFLALNYIIYAGENV